MIAILLSATLQRLGSLHPSHLLGQKLFQSEPHPIGGFFCEKMEVMGSMIRITGSSKYEFGAPFGIGD